MSLFKSVIGNPVNSSDCDFKCSLELLCSVKYKREVATDKDAIFLGGTSGFQIYPYLFISPCEKTQLKQKPRKCVELYKTVTKRLQ